MFRVVLVQFLASLLVAALAALWGAPSGITALLGGTACWLPNGLFALNLALLARMDRQRLQNTAPGSSPAPASASFMPILAGEFFKVLLMAALLALVVWGYRDVVWPALIASLSVVLLAQPIALALREP